MTDRLTYASEALTNVTDKAEWLHDELTAVLGADSPLLELADYLVSEAWRANVLIALAQSEA